MFTQSKRSTGHNTRAAYSDHAPVKDFIRPDRTDHDQFIHNLSTTFGENRGFISGFRSTPHRVPTTPCQMSSTMVGDTSLALCRRTGELMKRPTIESPAKVFARMKVKVQSRHQVCEDAGTAKTDNHVFYKEAKVFISPLKRSRHWTIDDLKNNQRLRLAHHVDTDVEALTFAPRTLSQFHSQVGSNENQRPKAPLKKDLDSISKTSNRTTPAKNQAAVSESTAHSCENNRFVEQVLLKGGPTQISMRNPRRTSTPVFNGHEDDVSVSSSFSGVAVPVAQAESSIPSSPEAANSQFEVLPAEAPPPMPLPDPMDDALLSSPRISIPKKRVAVFQTKPVESKGADAPGVHLRGWILLRSSMGLYVDGDRVDSGGPWHSSVITERVSSNVLKTKSGGTYVLVGRMGKMVPGCKTTGFPKWFLDKFLCGFPRLWKDYYQTYLSESKGVEADSIRQKDMAPAEKHHNRSMKQQSSQPQKTRTQRTPADISTADTTLNSGAAKVSRSGRVLKAPLDYWLGGRVILDSHMKVTVHEAYDISICNSHVSTPVSTHPSKRTKTPATALLSPLEEVDVVLRKVKSHERRPQNIWSEGDISDSGSPTPDLLPVKSSLNHAELSFRARKTHEAPRRRPGRPRKHPGRPRKTQEDPGSTPRPSTQPATAAHAALPRRSARHGSQQSQEETSDADTRPTRLPSKQRKVPVIDESYSQAAGRRRRAPARKTPKDQESQSDMDREERDPERPSHGRKPRPASAATGRDRKAQGGGRHDNTGESAQSHDNDDDDVSRMPRVYLTRHSSKQRKVPVIDESYSQAAGRRRRAPARKTPKDQESQSDMDREERDPERPSHGRKPRPASAATGRDRKAQGGGRHDNTGESAQSHDNDDDDVSRMPRVYLTRHSSKQRKVPVIDESYSQAAGRRRRAPARKTPKDQESQSDMDREERDPERPSHGRKPRPASAATGRDRKSQGGGRHDNTGESAQSHDNDDVDVSIMPRVYLTRLPSKQRKIPVIDVAPAWKTPKDQESQSDTDWQERVPQPHKSTTKRNNGKAVSRVGLQVEEEEADQWTVAELARLHQAVTSLPKNMNSFWLNVAIKVGTRSAEECQEQHIAQTSSKVTISSQVTTKAKNTKKKKKEAPQKEQPVIEAPKITAKVGTLKRKKEVRNFLDNMPKDNHNDIFSSSTMTNKLVTVPPLSPSIRDDAFTQSGEYDPQTPTTSGFSAKKTPKCLHITPGMMGPMDGNNDTYLYRLNKRLKKGQSKVPKQARSAKIHIPTPSLKRTMSRCVAGEEDDSFVVWKMFPDKEAASDDSEEEDFYFQDDH